MSHYQAFGMLLIALGAGISFFLTQLWSRCRKDPRWILRGEFRDLVSPGASHILNAVLIVLGSLIALAAVGGGLLLMQPI